MTDNPIRAVPPAEYAAERAAIEHRVRRLKWLADHAADIAVYRRKMFLAFQAAGFDDYDARVMSEDGVPYL